MEKEFVPYEIALELKELGFDEPCFKFYSERYTIDSKTGGDIKISYFYLTDTPRQKTIRCSAPLYQQAFRWFREKYNILLDIVAYYDEKQLPLSKTNLQKPKGYFIWDFYDENFSVDKAIKFKDHEEAELECLKKLIEIVKEQK